MRGNCAPGSFEDEPSRRLLSPRQKTTNNKGSGNPGGSAQGERGGQQGRAVSVRTGTGPTPEAARARAVAAAEAPHSGPPPPRPQPPSRRGPLPRAPAVGGHTPTFEVRNDPVQLRVDRGSEGGLAAARRARGGSEEAPRAGPGPCVPAGGRVARAPAAELAAGAPSAPGLCLNEWGGRRAAGRSSLPRPRPAPPPPPGDCSRTLGPGLLPRTAETPARHASLGGGWGWRGYGWELGPEQCLRGSAES